MSAVGEPDLAEKLKKGYTAGDKKFKVHLDGYDLLPYLRGETDDSPRKEFLYWTDDGDLAALRYEQWKLVFMEQRAHSFEVWQEPFVTLRVPKLFTLRGDPFESADHVGFDYPRWRFERAFLLVPAQAYVTRWLSSFKDFPPRQTPASFGIDQVMEKLSDPAGGAN
jgi:arylsulfatase A-like enzyme